MQPRAASFDFGQTLAELDDEMLARRVAERSAQVAVAALERASTSAWHAYAEAKRSGLSGHDAWCAFMRQLLLEASVRGPRPAPELAAELAEWLWTEQPRHNLWRRLVPGMLDLVDELSGAGVPVAILSNSEGHLEQLVIELGVRERFRTVVDSGQLGFEKPDPRIFVHTAQALGVELAELVHVGDSWEADVEGALAVGARGVWFSPGVPPRTMPGRAAQASGTRELREVLRGLGLLPAG